MLNDKIDPYLDGCVPSIKNYKTPALSLVLCPTPWILSPEYSMLLVHYKLISSNSLHFKMSNIICQFTIYSHLLHDLTM